MSRTNIPRNQGGLGEVKIPLLADRSHAISRAYGVLKEDSGNAFRSYAVPEILFVIRFYCLLQSI